jgi:hypothetical protein
MIQVVVVGPRERVSVLLLLALARPGRSSLLLRLAVMLMVRVVANTLLED